MNVKACVKDDFIGCTGYMCFVEGDNQLIEFVENNELIKYANG